MALYRVRPGHKFFDCKTSREYGPGEIADYDGKEVGENLEPYKGPKPKPEGDAPDEPAT